LADDEGVDLVTLGAGWIGAVTDSGNVRVIGLSGVELITWKMMRPLVAMCAYEQLLVLAYLDSIPMFGC
jgi:hypothetical protein